MTTLCRRPRRDDRSKLQKSCGDLSKLQGALNSRGFVEVALIVAIATSRNPGGTDWIAE